MMLITTRKISGPTSQSQQWFFTAFSSSLTRSGRKEATVDSYWQISYVDLRSCCGSEE